MITETLRGSWSIGLSGARQVAISINGEQGQTMLLADIGDATLIAQMILLAVAKLETQHHD